MQVFRCSTIAEAERFIASLKVGQALRVRFRSRGTRAAEVVRKRRDGRPVIRTLDAANDRWSKPRAMEITDVLTHEEFWAEYARAKKAQTP